jgi:hypothetical protein
VTDLERVQLLFGPYKAPPLKRGDRASCLFRDCEVIVTGWSDAPIPWPIGQRPGRGARALVVLGGLADAVRLESNQAVAYWFGVTPQTVMQWRKALTVPRSNEGTHRLHHDHALEPGVAAARAKAHANSRDPATDAGRRKKIAAAKRGKPRPPGLMEALVEANRGRPLSEETRQKMSEAHKRRGTRPPAAGRPWSPDADALLRAFPAKVVARRTGRSLTAVYNRRIDLGLPDDRRRESMP